MNNTLAKIDSFLKEITDKENYLHQLSSSLVSHENKLSEIKLLQNLTSKALQALQDVRPILAAVSSEQSIALANHALRCIFLTDDTLVFNEEESRFYIKTPNGLTDLVSGNGGGYQAVISFIFTLFILVSSNSRRVLFYDEQFTQLSDECLARFIPFLKNLCKDMNLDICMITHDSRIEHNSVDHIYFLEEGQIKSIK